MSALHIIPKGPFLSRYIDESSGIVWKGYFQGASGEPSNVYALNFAPSKGLL